jgi:hypothetical protein
LILTKINELPTEEEIAVSIYNPQEDQLHTGLLYRDAQSEFRFLHLAFHFDLRDEVAHGDGTCAKVSIHPTNQIIAAVYAGQLVQSDPKIPYGLTYDGQCLDANAKYISGPVGHGLTCATFVVAIFNALQLPMLVEESWPSRAEDKAWFDRIVIQMEANLELYGIDPAHVDALKRDPVARRIRPEEVAAAATHADWPVRHQDIELTVDAVLADLEMATR